MKRRLRQTARAGVALAAALAAVALPQAAHAQRGGDFITQGEAPDTPKRGFPGAFNTHMPESRSVVTNGVATLVPFVQLDYGATENLAIGATALAVFGQSPGVIARLRYRLYERGRISAVTAFQAGYMPLEDEGEHLHAWAGYASASVGAQLSARQRLTGTLAAATLGTNSKTYRESSRIGAVALAADYELFFTDKLGLNLTALGVPALTQRFDSPGESVSASFNLAMQEGLIVRAAGLARLGKTWLLEAGVVAPVSLSVGVPGFSVTKTW